MTPTSSLSTQQQQDLLRSAQREILKRVSGELTRRQSSGRVAGASTSNLNAAQIGGARGIGFEDSSTQSEISSRVERTTRSGGSVSDAFSGSFSALSAPEAPTASSRNNAARLGNTSAVSASNLNSPSTPAATASSRSRVLTDKEVEDLKLEGFREGDFVPGRGVLKPDGSFDTTNLDQLELLDQVKQRALQLQQQRDNLAANESSSKFEGISTDEEIVREEEAAISKINEPESLISGALAVLDQQEKNIQDTLKAEIESANLDFRQDSGDLADKQARETGQLSVGLAASGGYLGFSGSGTGVMLTLTKSHRAELERLKLTRDKAISDARRAAAESRFDIVREKAQMLYNIEEEVYRTEQKYQADMKEAAEKQKEESAKKQNEMDIFNAIKNGNTSVEAIFNALGGKVDVDTISKFLKNTASNETGFKFTDTQTAKLLGSGLSADDVRALSEYVSENGYDETVRSAMTPAQKAAADKIFLDKATGQPKDIYSFTDQEMRKLRMAGLLDADWTEQAEYLYGDDKPAYESVYTEQILNNDVTLDQLPFDVQSDVRDELYQLGFGSSAIPQWFKDTLDAESNQSISPDILKAEWEQYRLKALGELPEEETAPWWKVWSS